MIMSHFPSLLLNPALVNVTRFVQTRLLGPEMGWSLSSWTCRSPHFVRIVAVDGSILSNRTGMRLNFTDIYRYMEQF